MIMVYLSVKSLNVPSIAPIDIVVHPYTHETKKKLLNKLTELY